MITCFEWIYEREPIMKKILLRIMTLAMVVGLATVVTTTTSVLAGTTLTLATTPITYEEKMPEFQKGFAYLKVNFKLPEGDIVGDKDLKIFLKSKTTNSIDKSKLESKTITLKKGYNGYTAYFPVTATGGKANALIQYVASPYTQEQFSYVPGCLTAEGTGLYFPNDGLELKEGSLQEITLTAIKGVPVTGNIQLPPGIKIPNDKKLSIQFSNGNGGRSETFVTITTKPLAQNPNLSFTALLPKNHDFKVFVGGVFDNYSMKYGTLKLDDTVLTNMKFNYPIILKTPEKVKFNDAGFEKVIRKSLKIENGDIYDYMLNGTFIIALDGALVKDFSDLSKIPEVSNLNITNIKNISPYTQIIGKLKNLSWLTIYGGDNSDISFVKGLKNLSRLTIRYNEITDISPIKDLTGITHLDFVSNQIVDFSPVTHLKKLERLAISGNKAISLDCLIDCKNLESFSGGANFQLKNYEFLKAMPSLKSVAVGYGSPNTDLSALLDLNESVVVSSHEKIKGKDGVKAVIAFNDVVNKILANIIRPEMSDFEKALAVHDYIVASTEYANEALELGDYGEEGKATSVILNKKGVCQGYAAAYSVFLKCLDIESRFVVSTSMKHMWNQVKIDNQWYHVDTTWDDPVTPEPGGSLNHKHFMLLDWQIRKNHSYGIAEGAENKYQGMTFGSNGHVLNTVDNNSQWYYKGYIYGFGKSIYKKKEDGTEKTIKILNKEVMSAKFFGENIVYIARDGAFELHRMNRDGSGDVVIKKLTSEYREFFVEEKGVWINDSGTVKLIDYKGKVLKTINLKIGEVMNVVDQWIYYQKTYTGLNRVNKDGKQDKVITNRIIQNLMFVPNNILFIDPKDQNKIISVNTETCKEKVLTTIPSSEFEIFDQWVYYKGINDKRWYRVRLDGSGNEKILNDISECECQ